MPPGHIPHSFSLLLSGIPSCIYLSRRWRSQRPFVCLKDVPGLFLPNLFRVHYSPCPVPYLFSASSLFSFWQKAPKKAKKRSAEGANSNVFSMFEQAQIQEFKEVRNSCMTLISVLLQYTTKNTFISLTYI